MQNTPARHFDSSGTQTHVSKSLDMKNGLNIQVTGRNDGLVACAKHGSDVIGHCAPGYRKMFTYKLSVDDDGVKNSDVKVDQSAPAIYSVTNDVTRNGLPIQTYGRTGKSSASRKGVKSTSKKKITITLRDLTSYYPATRKGSNSTEQSMPASSRKQLKDRPLGLVHSVQWNLVPSKSLPSLTTTETTTTTLEKTNPKPLHIKPVKQYRYSLNQMMDANQQRINYCDREKTKMILKWLADMEAD